MTRPLLEDRTDGLRAILEGFDKNFYLQETSSPSSSHLLPGGGDLHYEISPDLRTYHDYHTPRRLPSPSAVPFASTPSSVASDSTFPCSQHSRLWDSRVSSPYTATTATGTGTTPSPGIPTTGSPRSDGMPSIYSHSSAPSAYTGLTTFEQWQLTIPAAHGDGNGSGSGSGSWGLGTIPDFHLPCEFRWLTGCPLTFPHDGLSECVEHMSAEHLAYKFPRRCICWWCDEFFFDVEKEAVPEGRAHRRGYKGHGRGGGGSGGEGGDGGDGGGDQLGFPFPSSADNGARIFEARMEHIRRHIVHDGISPLARPPRPDFWMLDHLWRYRLIGRDVWDRERVRSEAPPCPGGGEVHAPGWRPPPRSPAERRRRDGEVAYDLEREERMFRRAERDGRREREGKEKGKEKGRGGKNEGKDKSKDKGKGKGKEGPRKRGRERENDKGGEGVGDER